MTSELTIPQEVAEQLGFYVYALRDPRDGRVFYIGKGVGDRINAHAREAHDDPASTRAKLARITEIEGAGHALELMFLRTGLTTDEDAFALEQAVIDAFAADHHPLTNLVRGHHAGTRGLATLDTVVARFAARPTPPIDAPLIMLKINRNWRPDSSAQDIYDFTRGYWFIGPRVRREARFALGVAFGVIRGAYEIDPASWHESPHVGDEGRWGFAGEPALTLANVVGTHVRDAFKPGSQNPYREYLRGYAGIPATDDRGADVG